MTIQSPAKQSKKILFVAMVLIIAAAMAYWYYTRLEWEEKEIDLGYSKEAKRNDFLAAELFLQKHGIPATTIKNLSLLETHRWRNLELGAEDTVILINANKTLTYEVYERIYEWVDNGGTLITSTQNPFVGSHTDEQDLLLSDFGIIPAKDYTAADFDNPFKDILGSPDKEDEENKKEDADNENSEKENPEKENPESDKPKAALKDSAEKDTENSKDERPENFYRCGLDEEPAEIVFGGEAAPLRFDFSRQDPFLIKDASEENSEPREAHFVYFDVGAGSISITSDNYIWSNRRIDCQDHAYALWSLVNPNGRVWFLVNQDAPSLAAIMWQSSPYGVLAGLLALVAWLWAEASRFGPVFNVNQQGRRSLAEHIYASAMLLWRKQQHPQLLKLLRTEILERLEQQNPQLIRENSRSNIIELLHQLTGLSKTEIQQALYAEDLRHPQTFADATATLQLIRKQL